MKKVILSILLFLSVPLFARAEVDYDITNFYINAYIEDNGDLLVQELIVLDGTFNGYERDILYANSSLSSGLDLANSSIYNATDISNVSIKAKYVDSVSFDTFNDTDFTSFSLTSSGYNGAKGLYEASNITNGYRYRMYYASNNQTVAFLLEYTIESAVVLHNDVAELYWTFIPDGFEDDLDDIQIKVYLPASDDSDNFRIWAHGELTGNIEFIDNYGAYAYISEVLSGESVDIRLTFNKSLITDTSTVKTSGITALDSIIEVEEERADTANSLRSTLLKYYNTVKYGTILYFIAIVILAIYIYLKFGKSPKPEYYSKYNREFIDDYNVEVIDYLMNRKITPNAMSASIMNLIYKKNISVTEVVCDKKAKTKDYSFTLENTDNLNESEEILIDFLFNRVAKEKEGEKKSFTTMDLKLYAGGTKTCDTFINSYTKWQKNVISKGKSEQFFVDSATPKVIGVVMIVIGFLLFVYGLNHEVEYYPLYFMPLVIIIFAIYSFAVYKKTPKGSEHYARWSAFKNFLKDFGSFELKELPEIILWEKYLVYATIFGLADKVEKSMNVHIKEIDVSNYNYNYVPSFVYLDIAHSINHSVNYAINRAYNRQSANYSNSHSSFSSGSGFGGGFSSGGGFGGGGGGGRGF